MSSRKTAGRRGTTKKRAQRATSNVFAMFNQDQIQEFKEAFNMIDQNRDGFIDKEDLHDMLASLGKDPTDEYLDAMMNEAPGAINFTMFLTLFGERLQGIYLLSKHIDVPQLPPNFGHFTYHIILNQKCYHAYCNL